MIRHLESRILNLNNLFVSVNLLSKDLRFLNPDFSSKNFLAAGASLSFLDLESLARRRRNKCDSIGCDKSTLRHGKGKIKPGINGLSLDKMG